MLEYNLEANKITMPAEFVHGYELGLVNHFFQKSALEIDRVYFNAPYTIVIWDDGTKTVVKCSKEDIYHRHTGLAMCALKKILGDEAYSEWKRAMNRVFDPRKLKADLTEYGWTYAYRAK